MVDRIEEIREKERRIIDLIEEKDLGAVVIGRQDNFAWLTGGGRNYILTTSDFGACMIVVTPEEKYLVANTMDGMRILNEELNNSGYELINLKWYEKSIDETVSDLIKGKKAISDVHIDGAVYALADIYGLHYPLTSGEVKRYRESAALAESIIKKTADEIKPGMSEKDIEAMLLIEYAKNGFNDSVILVGSDERIVQYRHPIPTAKKVEKMVMLAPAPRKNGFFNPITRMIYFGDRLPADTEAKYAALLAIEANVFARCVPGASFSDIHELELQLYKNSDYPEEWRNHFLGGLTGYLPNDPMQYANPEAKIKTSQSFNWYLTITGVKVEETLLTTEDGNELLSENGIWPVKRVEACGKEYKLPDILLK